MPAIELSARVAGRILPLLDRRVRAYDCLFVLHDHAVSLSRWPPDTAAVYAYEDGALATLRRARRSGLAAIWDLPLPHHEFLSSMWQEETSRWPTVTRDRPREPPWKVARKDEELDLADAICVASRFTQSTLPGWAHRKPVIVVPYGYPTDRFRPKAKADVGPFLAVSVGTQNVRKGTHYLLEAWRLAGLKDARLRLIGPIGLEPEFLAPYQGLFEHVPHLPKPALEAEYQAADLLVFPTLGDGFGLVIQESMASGTPVLTTPCGGGPECVTDGVEGWIVPPRDVGAMVDVLRFAAANRDQLHRMGEAARRRAESWSWQDAGDRLITELEARSLL
jgi:glycosyltransferase involved in cell wall biosynthesis